MCLSELMQEKVRVTQISLSLGWRVAWILSCQSRQDFIKLLLCQTRQDFIKQWETRNWDGEHGAEPGSAQSWGRWSRRGHLMISRSVWVSTAAVYEGYYLEWCCLGLQGQKANWMWIICAREKLSSHLETATEEKLEWGTGQRSTCASKIVW